MSDLREFEASFRPLARAFRPLAAATAGAGVLAITAVQFAAEAWGSLEPPARLLAAEAARLGFLTFLITIAVLLAAYLLRTALGRGLAWLFNLFGATVFLIGAFLTGVRISRALNVSLPADGPVPEDLAAFVGVAAAAGTALVAVAVVSAALGLVRKKA